MSSEQERRRRYLQDLDDIRAQKLRRRCQIDTVAELPWDLQAKIADYAGLEAFQAGWNVRGEGYPNPNPWALKLRNEGPYGALAKCPYVHCKRLAEVGTLPWHQTTADGVHVVYQTKRMCPQCEQMWRETGWHWRPGECWIEGTLMPECLL